MVKVFIDPGHGGNDPGAVGNGLVEKDITLDISLRLEKFLIGNYQNVSVNMSRRTDKTVSLSERTRQANNWDADLYISIHINAGGGLGFESYIFNGQFSNKNRTQRIRAHIHDTIMENLNWTDRGKKEANFHVLRETRMPAVLTESGFIDRREDARNMRDSSWLQSIAESHGLGIAKAFNLTAKEAPETNQRLYRVVSGSFKEMDNATKRVKSLKTKGFGSYILPYDNQGVRYYRVIVGVFRQFDNAQNRVSDLNNHGYDSFIVEV